MRIKNWSVFYFMAGYHLLLVALLPFFITRFSWAAIAFMLVTWLAGGLSITAGYHRLFSHRAYTAHPAYEWVVLLLSTLSFQWSALSWSHDHRLHHNHVDTDEDPYSIKKGFWYAHMFWLFDYDQNFRPRIVSDLLRNPRVVFQDRHFLALAIVVNLAVFGIGCLFLHPFVSFYAGVLLRLFAIHHCTWFINSLAHTYGSKTYAKELSAVDNAVLAVLTFGEGYHNYHHVFAGDYRNGIRWYHFDPTKWIVWTASKFGITQNLKTVDRIRLQETLVLKDKKLLLERLNHELDEFALELRQRIEHISAAFEENCSALKKKVQELKNASSEKQQQIQREIRLLKAELKSNWKAWVSLTNTALRNYEFSHTH